MGQRWQRLAAEISRFVAVGGVATLVAFLMFNFLVHGYAGVPRHPWLAAHAIWAYVIANSVGMAISYRGSRTWAFKHRPPVHADGGRTWYIIINVATMALPIACLKVSRDVLGHTDPLSDNISANVIGLGLGMAARWYLFRTIVFRKPDYAPAALTGVAGDPGDLDDLDDVDDVEDADEARPGPRGHG